MSNFNLLILTVRVGFFPEEYTFSFYILPRLPTMALMLSHWQAECFLDSWQK